MNFIRKYLYLIILSSALVLGAVGVSMVSDVPRPQLVSEEVAWPEFFVKNPDGSQTERVTIYDAGDGNCYVFLPSYAEFDSVTVTAGKGQTFTLNGMELTQSVNCGSFQLGIPYEFTADGAHLGNLWFYRSENIPAIYIDTASGNLEELHHFTYSFEEEFASTRVYSSKGKLDYLEDYATIKCRGYTSSSIDKKSYTLSLGRSTGLLGMGNSEKWTLTANGFDPTRLRNRIVYSFAELVAPCSGWAPDCAFAELYLNGEYAGLYLLCQKPDAGPDHMNLEPEDYYFEIFPTNRGFAGSMMFDFCESRTAEVKFPKEIAEDQLAFIQARVEELHSVLVSEEENQWQNYIDLNSWVRKYLLEETFRNSDGGKASTYIRYKTSEEKFYMGHCWDYDGVLSGLGTKIWNFPNSMPVIRNWKYDVSWFGGLYQKELFQDAVKELYEKEFQPLLMEYAKDTIPELAQEISGAIESEYLRWPELRGNTDWESAVEEMITFLQARIAFLDEMWLEGEQFYEIEVNVEKSNVYVAAGMTAEELPPNSYNPEGIWYLEGTDIPFDVTQQVTRNIRLAPLPASETPSPTEENTEVIVDTVPKSSFATQDYITVASIGFFVLLIVCFACIDFFQRRKDKGTEVVLR